MIFTLAGSVIVYSTLKGELKRIALITTLIAVAVHYSYSFWKYDD